MSDLNNKLCINALIGEKLMKLDRFERKEVIRKLNETLSYRQISEMTGIPKSTLQDWSSLRQNNTGKDIHISISNFYRKIMSLEKEDIKDRGRLEMIKERIEYLLRWGGNVSNVEKRENWFMYFMRVIFAISVLQKWRKKNEI